VNEIKYQYCWGDGGIGRRNGLKIRRWRQREGSIPSRPTTNTSKLGVFYVFFEDAKFFLGGRPPLAPQQTPRNSGCFVFFSKTQSSFLGAGPLSPHNEHSETRGVLCLFRICKVRSWGQAPSRPTMNTPKHGVFCVFIEQLLVREIFIITTFFPQNARISQT